jgi:hypothetical protein
VRVSYLDQEPTGSTSPRAQRLPVNVAKTVRARGGYGTATTGVVVAGTPDFIGCFRGRALAWEFKTGSGRASARQQYQLKQWAAAGADAAIVRTVDEAVRRLDQIAEETSAWT